MSKRKKIAAAVLVLSLLAAALLIFLGVRELADRKAGQDYYADLLSQAVLIATPEPTATATIAPTDTVAPETAAPTATPVPTDTAAPDAAAPTATPTPVTPIPPAQLAVQR